MQANETFSYQIVNKTSIRSSSLAQLQQCIKDVIENSEDLQSLQSISTISAFKNCVSAQFKAAQNTKSEGYYLNSLFSLLSYNSLQKSNLHYLLIMNALISTDLGEKKNKAMNISKDIISIQPDLNPEVWTLLEKILVWLTNPLGTSMHLTLHPLRDTIWKWYFSGDSTAIISSLSLLNIFIKRFYILLIPAFNSFQNLLTRTIQDSDIKIRNKTIEVLESSLQIIGSSSDGPIRRLFDGFRDLIENDYNPILVESIISVFEHSADYCYIMQFSKTMIEKLNPNDQASLLLIPFIYKCKPSVFTSGDIKHILEMFKDFLAANNAKKKMIYKALGNFGFNLSKFIIESHQIQVNSIVEAITIDSRVSAYAFLSLVDPQSDYFYDKMSDLFELTISTFLARGMRMFIRRWPDSAHQFRSYVMSQLNKVVLISTEAEKLTHAFNILAMFQFRDDEMSNQMIDQYSLMLRHPSSQVREKCASFLVEQQRVFPSAVYRLVAFVSIETVPELRAETISKIIVQPTQSDMITPLHSLLTDRQTEIVYKALTLLCEIREASHFIMEFTCDIINRLNRSTTLEGHYVTCLLILARNHFIYIRPFVNIIIDYLLKCERQTASSLELISILVNDIDFEIIIPKLEPILIKSLNRNSSNRKVSAALKLFTVLLSSQSFRIQLRSTREILINNLIDLFSSTDSEKIRTQILEVVTRIGVITPLAVRSLFTRPVKRFNNNTIAPLDGLSNLPVYAASFAVSSITEILASEDFSCLQGLALETLLIILKKFRTIPMVIHDEILETICKTIRGKSMSTTTIILNNVPTLIRIFDKKAEIFIPDIISIIFENWGKIDLAILLTGIEWMAYRLPDAVAPFASKILSMIVPELSTAKPKEAENIFVAIACFGKLSSLVDTLIMQNVIPWIEGHIHETEVEAYILEKFADILKGMPIEKFYVRIYQMLTMITKENSELIPQVIEILSVIIVRMKNEFEIFIPEILQFYDLRNFDTFWKIIECISTHRDIPPKWADQFIHPNINRMFQDFPEQPFSSFEYILPEFEAPHPSWDALQWNKWINSFMNLIILKSPSKAISACMTICERDHKVRSALFSVSFALCVSECSDPQPLHNILKIALTSDGIPLYARGLFLSAVEILMLHNIDVRVPESVIGEKAMQAGNLSLALRCFENIFKQTGDSSKLVKVNLMLGQRYLARKLAKCDTAEEAELVGNWEKAYELYLNENNKEKINLCLEKMNKFETLSKLQLKGEKAADVALFNCSNEFRDLAETDFHKAVIAILDGKAQEASDIIKKIRDAVFPHILSNTDFDYGSITNEMSSASRLVDLEDAARILELRLAMVNSTPHEKTRIEDKINRLFEMWDEKFDSLDPSSLFLTIIIRRSVSPPEKTADGFLKFLRKYHNDATAGELVDIAFKRLSILDPKRYVMIDNLLNKSVDKFEEAVKNSDVFDDNWRHELGRAFLAAGDHGKAVKYLPRHSLDWAKAALNLFERNNDFSLIEDIFSTFIKFDGIHFLMAILSRKVPEIESIINARVDLIPPVQLTDFLSQIVALADRPVYMNLLSKYFKAAPNKAVFAMVHKVINNQSDLFNKFISDDQSIKNIVQFVREMVNISTTYHERIAISAQKFVDTQDLGDLISLYSEEDKSGVVNQFFQLNPDLKECKRLALLYNESLQESDLHQCYDAHKAFISKIVMPKEYSLSDISHIEEKGFFTKITLPFADSQIGRFGSIIAQENYSKTIKTILDSGITSSFTIRNRSHSFIDERAFILLRLISRILKSQKTSFAPPVIFTVPLTSTISLEKSSPCFSLEEAIKQSRRRQSGMADERDWIIDDFDSLSPEEKLSSFRQSLASTRGDDLENVIIRGSVSIQGWMERRTMYISSLAIKCITGYIFGIGDRKLSNIMMELATSKVYNAIYYPCFVPSKVPFRLSRVMANALDTAGVSGALEREMKDCLDAICREKERLLRAIEPSVRDENLRWANKCEQALEFVSKRLEINQSSLEVVKDLISVASSDENLSMMPAEWNPWW